MNCDKYKKKALIGVLIILSWFLLLLGRDLFNSSLYKYIGGIYILVSFFFSMKFISKYVNCIVNYNRRTKPPFKR